MLKVILIVDDDANMRLSLSSLLLENGYKVWEAANGKEALEKAKEKPDVILLDTRLPDMDGYEVCRKIKAMKDDDSRIIVYTGYVDVIDYDKAMEAGADDYAVKTADFSLLLEAIKKMS